jgi:hypothetical protein
MRAWIVGSLLQVALLALALPASAQPYQTIGKAKCVNCHDHEAEKLWSEKKDGPPPNNHLNALRQLESPKSAGFAKAIGLADPYDPRGSCASCHGTILKGTVVDGVTCENCHGAGSGYVDLHQQKGAYEQAVGAGLADTMKNPDAWAPMCVKCHVLGDSALIQAGHPSGDDFDLGAKFATVALHWKSIYPNQADIVARARPARGTVVASRKPIAAAPAAANAAAGAVSLPTAAPSAPTVVPSAAASVPNSAPATAAPNAPPATSASSAAPAIAPRADARAAPPAVLTGSPPVSPAASSAAVSVPLMPATVLALPLSPSAAVAAVQGRVLMILDSLLRRDAREVVRVTPPPPSAYRGPDADLLRLQEEVLSLAIESLATAPAPRKP